MCRLATFLLILSLFLPPAPLRAVGTADTGEQVASLCDAAGQAASRATGVPEPVLRAIALTETGRNRGGRLRPWPWTVNMEGKGRWFDARDEAMAWVMGHHARGARSYDIGCFQINYRWHGNAFASIEEMFDPGKNALYAAQFLARLYAETGSWSKAAAAYHSRTPKYADKYRARFDRILARLTNQPLPPPPSGAPSTTSATALLPEPDAPAGAVPPPSVQVAGPLTISTPSGGRRGSLMPVEAIPGGRSLLSGAGRPLY
ncbi:transglycosylase SLT domain-containing protein [Oceanibium sediminis]|uniref:transglycosylase SLT domain-containing protein n=1 Tax=Oceanibium sediminis TaxID=2026339 RepID=UPI000DD30D3B|nr:transglycosylase SLT domain-containing protein [Oceanibium sediminis]